MGGIDSGADESVADIVSGRKSSLHIRAVEGIYIDGISDIVFLGELYELCHYIVIVGAASVLCGYGYLVLGAGKSLPDAAHIHRPCLGNSCGAACGSAVAYLLVDGKVHVYTSFKLDIVVLYILCIAHKDSC